MTFSNPSTCVMVQAISGDQFEACLANPAAARFMGDSSSTSPMVIRRTTAGNHARTDRALSARH